jgi:hypothetical protein
MSSGEQKRRELEAQLAELEQNEREQAEQQRQAEQAERDAQLDPELRTQKEELERRAHAALEREFPPAWSPQKRGSDHPSELVGLVLRVDPRVGPSPTYGTYSAVIELRATHGKEWTIWCNEGGALYAQLVRLRVQPGEVVAVRYGGLRDSTANPGQSYHHFKLARVEDDDQPAAPVDYDALQRGKETPALPVPEQVPADIDDDIPY